MKWLRLSCWDYAPKLAELSTTALLYELSVNPGFPKWIGPAGPKASETLAKLPILSFTRRVRQKSFT
jgi:hypothetical protein